LRDLYAYRLRLNFMWRSLLLLDRGRGRNFAAQLRSQSLRIVRVHLHVKLSARHRHLGHAAVDEFAGSLFRVHVYQQTLCSLPLAVARHHIAVIEMRMLPRVELDFTPVPVVGAFRGSALYPYPDSFPAWESRLSHVAAVSGRVYGRSGAIHHVPKPATASLDRS